MIGKEARAARTVALALLVGCSGAAGAGSGAASPGEGTQAEPAAEGSDVDLPAPDPLHSVDPSREPEVEQTSFAPDPPPPRPAPDPRSPTKQLMDEHFEEAEALRAAIIGGKQDEIEPPALTLVYLSYIDELPASWRESAERMQDSARRVVASHDLAVAAAGMADIGTSCGECHVKLGGPKTSVPAVPRGDGSVAARMTRHGWATERLWEGLFVPSNDAWQAGLAALKDEPFPDAVLKDGGTYARSAADDFAKVVARAPSKKSTKDKASVYAQLLTTCGTCHIAMESGSQGK